MTAAPWSKVAPYLPYLTILGALLAWQLLASLGPLSPGVFPGPDRVLERATDYPLTALATDLGFSLWRLLSGFILAVVAGTVLGILSGASTKVSNLVHVPMELLRPIPPLAWIAVAVIWLGLGEASKVFIIFIAAFFPVYLAAFRGVRSVGPELLEAAATLGVTGWRALLKVMTPAALPDIAVGLRIGWGLAFTALVGAEVIAGRSGLGYMVMNARATGDIPLIMYGVLLIGLLGWASDALMTKILYEKLLPWHFSRPGS